MVSTSARVLGYPAASPATPSGAAKGLPRFSVVIPLYNKRAFIRRAVDSVLAQIHSQLELIVVDDGSTDAGYKTLSDVNDHRLRMIWQANAGVSAARNRGIAEARYEWVALLDADDMWLPDHLQVLSAVIKAHPACGLVAAGFVELRGNEACDYMPRPGSAIREVDYFAEASKSVGFINSSCTAIRRNIIAHVGGFGPFKAGEDLECWARIALEYPIAISTKVTSIYFRGTGGAMEQLTGTIGCKPSPVRTLGEISPSVGLLCEALSDERHRAKIPSLQAYVNARVFQAVKTRLVRADIAGARSTAQLFIGRIHMKARLLRHALSMPDIIVLMLLRVYGIGRDLRRR